MKYARKVNRLRPSRATVVQVGRRGVKRWTKGHSSDSNPTIHKYRNAARKNVLTTLADTENTKISEELNSLENLKISLNSANIGDDENDSASLHSASTVATRLSQYTNCTNPTFNKVHQMWRTGSAIHADVLAVLATVTDAIKSKHGKESEVEYCAALLSTLADPNQPTNLTAATAYLLLLVMKKVPKNILVSRCEQLATILYAALSRQLQFEENNKSAIATRYLVHCLGVLLASQTNTVWKSSASLLLEKIFTTMLDLCLCERNRVRKAAVRVVSIILNDVDGAPKSLLRLTPRYCLDKLEQSGGGVGENLQISLHSLNLMQNVMHRFDSPDLKRACETIFKLLTLSAGVASATSLHCLYVMFQNRPAVECMSAELNAKLIMAIYDFQPPKEDRKSILNWVALLTEAHACLLSRDVQMGGSMLPRLGESLSKVLASVSDGKQQLTGAVVESLRRIYSEFLPQLQSSSNRLVIMEKCLETLEKMLGYQFYSVWPIVLELLASFFESTGVEASSLSNFNRCLQSMSELQESEMFPCKVPLEKALGAAIRFVGAEAVLTAVPLDFDPAAITSEFRRSWLLPVLRKHVSNGKLSFFVKYFMPMVIRFGDRVKQLSKEGQLTEAKIFTVIEQQLWDLLPSFCDHPTDVVESFPTIARALGAALLALGHVRGSILSALRKLLKQCDDNDDVRRVMLKYAKNYMNILFTLFTDDTPKEEGETPKSFDEKKQSREIVLAAIGQYAAIASVDLIGEYLENICEKLDDAEQNSAKKLRFMDLLLALAPYADDNNGKRLLKIAEANVNTPMIQKKAWRLLEELCRTEAFVRANLKSLSELMEHELPQTSSAVKACRLQCLIVIMETLKNKADEEAVQFAMSVFDEAVESAKTTSGKTKKKAAAFLVKMASVLISSKKDANAGLQIMFKRLTNPSNELRHITGSLTAARILIYEYRNDISTELVSEVLALVCTNLQHARRAVVESAIECLKTFVTFFSELVVGQFLEVFMPALCSQNEKVVKHLRYPTRRVLAKLVKRFGYETVKKHAPESYQKQLVYLRRALARLQRKSAVAADGTKKRPTPSEAGTVISGFTQMSRPDTIADLLRDTSESESEESEQDRRSVKSKHSAPLWLKESGVDGDVVDLLDAKLAQQISSTKPKSLQKHIAKEKPEEPDRGFKTSPDGRLIILFGSDDEKADKNEPKAKKRKRQGSTAAGNEDAISVHTRTIMGDDYTEADAVSRSSYKPGGKGIHRPLTEEADRPRKRKKAEKVDKSVAPYSYTPLDRGALNKRKRAKFTGKFKHIIEGARKGAAKGTKEKARSKR